MPSPQRSVILCCLGTRPEVIKMAPVIKALQQTSWAQCRVLATAQHRDLLDQMLAFFAIAPDVDLNIMTENQTLPELTSRLLLRLDQTLATEQPALVLAQGDTTTVFVTALASFYRGIPFGHIEAGLRTHNMHLPFPEEGNRVLAGHLATLHFAPTPTARDNLLREGMRKETVYLTGNTVIDALWMAVAKDVPLAVPLDPQKRLLLITAHRRENFGAPLRHICQAVLTLCQQYPDIECLWPVHPNPTVRSVVEDMVRDVARIHVCDPLSYGSFVTAMRRSYLILTDSGGVQEEAPALGKPVLVMRQQSERPETIQAGVSKLVGLRTETIVAAAQKLLDDPATYAAMSIGGSPYGDGAAAGRIVQAVHDYLEVTSP